MFPIVHPTEEILLAVANGESDLPRRVLVEGHLDGCAECRATMAEMTLPGGALLRGLDGEAPPAGVWEALRGRVTGLRAPSPEVAAMPFSPSVRGELPALATLATSRRFPWRWALAPGAWYAELARDPWTQSVLLLGYLAPQRFLPAHRHLAQEEVLVLAGGFDDRQGRHEAGEYAIYEPGSEHRPATEPDEECWCLARLERPNLLLGWRGWLQRLTP